MAALAAVQMVRQMVRQPACYKFGLQACFTCHQHIYISEELLQPCCAKGRTRTTPHKILYRRLSATKRSSRRPAASTAPSPQPVRRRHQAMGLQPTVITKHGWHRQCRYLHVSTRYFVKSYTQSMLRRRRSVHRHCIPTAMRRMHWHQTQHRRLAIDRHSRRPSVSTTPSPRQTRTRTRRRHRRCL